MLDIAVQCQMLSNIYNGKEKGTYLYSVRKTQFVKLKHVFCIPDVLPEVVTNDV